MQYSVAGQVTYTQDYVKGKAYEHVYLAGSLIASRESNLSTLSQWEIKYQHNDALGSPVAVTNPQGQVIERTHYERYSKVIGRQNDDLPGYTGHVMDQATGLAYMQQRSRSQHRKVPVR